ncbi:hypothetical protein BaRGS_00039676 [Batillaria attramentaria]|uniref:PiggyBac transposable element-derived protein 4 C-terminal zinc-finger domain-containing protein n=1 Tax=Batillaria attramentaria TaxID=370345 RepID=A0ABD0J2Z2_9CAEN
MQAERLSMKENDHFSTRIEPTDSTSKRQRICVACSIRGKDANGKSVYLHKRETRFKCNRCNVGLCQEPCFFLYHTRVELKSAVVEAQQLDV